MYSGSSLIKAIYTVFLNPSFQMVFWYRAAHMFYRMHLSVLSRIIMFFHKIVFSVDIDYRAEIGKGFKAAHGVGIVIGKGVVIGDYVTVYQGVTIGGNFGKSRTENGKKKSFPTIGSNVKLLARCCVFGPVTVGSGSIISAGSIITRDVPEKSFVYTESNLVITGVR